MRRSREETAETRRAILRAASELFRARGISAVSVADIMTSLGLTVGGFYRHFESKEALVAESIEAASLETNHRFAHPKARSGAGRRRAALNAYLSLAHRANLGKGCPVAALCSEVAHADPRAKRAFTTALERLIHLVGHAVPKKSAAHRDDVLSAAATLVGALVLARATNDDALAAELLHAAKKSLARGPRQYRRARSSAK